MYVYVLLDGVFFVFKQKTAYEMRISDWSSDVCSSDLTVWHRSGSCALQIAPSQCELGLQGALGDAHRVAVVRHHRADDGLLRQEAGIRHAAGRLAQQQRQ